MDNWWPIIRQPRRGRSSIEQTFPRLPPGSPIRSEHPYAFADSLLHQNLVVMGREDADPLYCGEVGVVVSLPYFSDACPSIDYG
jgi:hypothetical protein